MLGIEVIFGKNETKKQYYVNFVSYSFHHCQNTFKFQFLGENVVNCGKENLGVDTYQNLIPLQIFLIFAFSGSICIKTSCPSGISAGI